MRRGRHISRRVIDLDRAPTTGRLDATCRRRGRRPARCIASARPVSNTPRDEQSSRRCGYGGARHHPPSLANAPALQASEDTRDALRRCRARTSSQASLDSARHALRHRPVTSVVTITNRAVEGKPPRIRRSCRDDVDAACSSLRLFLVECRSRRRQSAPTSASCCLPVRETLAGRAKNRPRDR